jgi:hypothetical protein
MIVDLPPGSPVQALSDKVWAVLKEQPGIGPNLADKPPRVVYTLQTASEIYGPQYSFDAIADTTNEQIILYRSNEFLGFQPRGELRKIAMKMKKKRFPELTQYQAESLHLLIHEHLHFLQSGRQYFTMTPAQRDWEEGIVDVNSITYTQTVAWKLLKDRYAGTYVSPSYNCVDQVDTLSVRATFSKKAKDRNARLWQRDMLIWSPAQRDAEITRLGIDPNVSCEPKGEGLWFN